ncbi:Hsp70 family protein [Bosea sp. 2YAB26]|uniref:Hsp70 family protein n=1 Tax=unclassified Bosea (in: a-proteobacteria) TaxID=2653178 RepID=UPI003F90ABB1
MSHYVGIDLGTTNSAICSYDGETVQLYKSPEQNDVTPSAIAIDRRGNRYIGQRAYENAPRNPDSTAMLFKRHIGTSTPIRLPSVGITMTPEECSSEILRTLFGYLPEQIRNDETVATVITVPAAFNQMQKDATIEAARAAGLGKVALMQEPVAAVMSVMRSRQGDGIFLIYDLGGGTLDIAIAQSIGGRVSLLGQGGIQMCGGRDFDRMIVDNLVMPWLQQTFALPEGFSSLPEYKLLRRVAERAVEKAKIELSSRDNAVIGAQETECGCKDLAGTEIYLDVNITRDQLGGLIEGKVKESVQAARDTIEHAGLTPHDIERIVFVGGPTQYKPLRERVAFELGIAPSTDVNPMTAVATGAAIFAEAIDWSAHSRGRKSSRGSVSVGSTLDLTVNYAARTPDQKAKIALKLGSPAAPGSSFQVDSLDTGWSSGRAEIKNGTVIEVPLSKRGENTFKMFVFDPAGGPLSLAQDRIVITQTAATIDAIPASHSIGVEVLDTVGDIARLHYLVKAGDQLPARGVQPFKAAEALRAGASGSLKFKLWEGDIDHPVSDNTFIGLFEITGNDFVDGVIPAGAPLILTYEIGDGGNIDLKVEIPAIGGSFQSDKNFYSRASGMIDYSSAARRILDEASQAAEQLAEVSAKVDDPALSEARERLELAASISEQESDPEVAKQASDNVQRAKSLLASARKANFRVIRRMELDQVVAFFHDMRALAKPAEVSSFEALQAATERLIGTPGHGFEANLQELRRKIGTILRRQDWFIVDRFKDYASAPHLFTDPKMFEHLVAEGERAIAAGDIEGLRAAFHGLGGIRIVSAEADDLIAMTNIVTA